MYPALSSVVRQTTDDGHTTLNISFSKIPIDELILLHTTSTQRILAYIAHNRVVGIRIEGASPTAAHHSVVNAVYDLDGDEFLVYLGSQPPDVPGNGLDIDVLVDTHGSVTGVRFCNASNTIYIAEEEVGAISNLFSSICI